MHPHKTTILVAPVLHNASCTDPRYSQVDFLRNISPGDILQAITVLLLTIGILGANMLLILVINSRRYTKYIHSQPRYLLTSLASNDLAMGLLVTPFAIVPSLRHCWPYGELMCQIQALLRGAISQQSAVILICMAMDRYLCMLHPSRYHKHSSKKGCVALISLTWITSVTLFSILVLPRGGYYFNSTGMLACDPFYSRASIRILAACGFYFPTTMILMYCYGSAFHVNKLRLRNKGTAAAVNGISSQQQSYIRDGEGNCDPPNDETITTTNTPYTNTSIEHTHDSFGTIERLVSQERRLSISASRTMAAMSLGFIVLVTPWTIQEVVAACTGSKAPPLIDFMATWLALSNSFWNPFLYWLLNNHFRRISRELLFHRVCGRWYKNKSNNYSSNSINKYYQHQQHYCTSSTMNNSSALVGSNFLVESSENKRNTQQMINVRNHEMHWGEILERSLSSNSLHALHQNAYQMVTEKMEDKGNDSCEEHQHHLNLNGDVSIQQNQHYHHQQHYKTHGIPDL